MNQDNPLKALASLRQRLALARMRLPVLVTGTPEIALAQLKHWILPDQGEWLWLSSRAPSGAWRMAADKANHELGQEADGVVVDLFDGFPVDAVAALAGVVRAGGLMVFLAPELADWADFDDPFYARITVEPFGVAGVRRYFLPRMARRFGEDARVLRLKDGEVVLPSLDLPPAPLGELSLEGQQVAVEAILSMAAFPASAPLVIQADRGRGKSAALGMAAAQLAAQGLKIMVTAPRPEAAETLMRFAGKDSVMFMAPDRLTLHYHPADLLLVDEAAALAPSLLLELLARYPRTVLATTVQGYEGTGQGFNTRFARDLDKRFPRWQRLRLEQPIRWATGDPLEAFINDSLLLNACDEPPTLPPDLALKVNLQLQELTPHLASLPEARLRAVHGLLVAAHYRTRPSDLRTLLDGPNIRTFVVQQAGEIVGVVMLAEEGCLPDPLADAIVNGQRRPHGHVLPQSLAVHLNVPAALQQRSWRVVRIAVHSQWQRKGIGRWLLEQLEQQARDEKIACLGSIFAASETVLAFWQNSGFDAVRVGISRESTSGAFPVLVLKGLSCDGVETANQARQRFENTFLYGLADTPEPWPASLILQAWQQARFPLAEQLWPGDSDDIRHYIAGHKTFENAAVALARQTRLWLGAGLVQQHLDAAQQQLLVGRLLQKQPWAALVEQGGFSGHKQARAALRAAIIELERHFPLNTCLSS